MRRRILRSMFRARFGKQWLSFWHAQTATGIAMAKRAAWQEKLKALAAVVRPKRRRKATKAIQ